MVHTVISLVAVAAGVVALVRYGEINSRITSGRIYLIMTVLTCLTGFFIFQHGGFGKPHALGILTLLVMAIALAPNGGTGSAGCPPMCRWSATR
jgi:uncharacterized membrane protein